MSYEHFSPTNRDTDHFAMVIDRRPFLEQLKDLVGKLLGKKQDWQTPQIVDKKILRKDLDND